MEVRFFGRLHLLTIALLLCSFPYANSQPNKRVIEIEGKINGVANGYIFLRYDIVPNDIRMYSSEVINGKFHFKAEVTEPTAAVLSTSTTNSAEYLYLDTSAMMIDAKIDSLVKDNRTITSVAILKVSGSPSHDIYRLIITRLAGITESEVDPGEKGTKLYSLLDSLVKKHPDNNTITQALLFNEMLSFQQASSIYSQLSQKQQQRAPLNGIQKKLGRLKRTEQGEKFVMAEQRDKDGNLISSIPDQGVVTLLDFWASWCHPCRAVHPELKKIFSKYSQYGFNIVGISLDTDKEKWIEAIKADGISWTNTSDLKGFSGATASYYSLNFIPFNLVVDRDGLILFKNISMTDLAAYLEKKIK